MVECYICGKTIAYKANIDLRVRFGNCYYCNDCCDHVHKHDPINY